MKKLITALSGLILIASLSGSALAATPSSLQPATSTQHCNSDPERPFELCGKVIGTKLHVSGGEWTFKTTDGSAWCGSVEWLKTTGGDMVLGRSRSFCVNSSTEKQTGDTSMNYTYPANGKLEELLVPASGWPSINASNTFDIKS
jgi:hypothetical protein